MEAAGDPNPMRRTQFGLRFTLLAAAGCMVLPAQPVSYRVPAGTHFAVPAGPSGTAGVLPGGRYLAPAGLSLITGPGPFGIAINAKGTTLATANIGREIQSISVLDQDKKGAWTIHNLATAKKAAPETEDWRSLFMGIAFVGDKTLLLAEGESGRVRLVDAATGAKRRVWDLNQNGATNSFAGDLVLDAARGIFYVVDQANYRLVAFDLKQNQPLASVKVGRLPFAVALAPDGKRAFVTCLGIFQYTAVPGADAKRPQTGLPFPAFGFPSPEAVAGGLRKTAAGEDVAVAGLGDPNVREANSLAIVNVANPAKAALENLVRTGPPLQDKVHGGSSPSAVLAVGSIVYVANAHSDSISLVDPAAATVTGEIPIRIPTLETLRGVLPLGMAWDDANKHLLVAEAGINAVGVIDPAAKTVLGHIPVGWFPVKPVVEGGTLYVANAKGRGAGPSTRAIVQAWEGSAMAGVLLRGTVTVVPLPAADELAKMTKLVYAANGFLPSLSPAPALPPVKHVVLIVKENRTFDEVFGDQKAANGPVAGIPKLARYGRSGYADGQGGRLSLQKIDITPNHHALADQFAFSDNFHADSDVSVDGHHWLVGAYPDAWTESSLLAAYAGQKSFRLTPAAPGRLQFAESNSSVHPEEMPEAGTIWEQLEAAGKTFRNFGEGFELAGVQEEAGEEPTGARFLTNVPMPDALYRNTSREYPGFNTNIPDQFRAKQFIQEFDRLYGPGQQPMPDFIYIHLPNDHTADARPADGYPYKASFVSDNDYALGRIVEHLSQSAYWKNMAIFITEDDAQGGRDHIDAHRTVLLAAGPWCRKNYASHVNSSFPGLIKTVFRLLAVPPLNLFDAAAADLSDVFTATPDPTQYRVLPVDPRVFDPATARASTSGKPSAPMDGRPR